MAEIVSPYKKNGYRMTQGSQTQPTQPSTFNPTNDDLAEDLVRSGVVCRLICTTATTSSNSYIDIKLKPDSGGRQEWLFGRRAEACDYALPTKCNRISNKHFKLWMNTHDKSKNHDSNVMIQDMSTNGTWINGSKLIKGTNYILTQGDEISVGVGVPTDVIRYVVHFPKAPEDEDTAEDSLTRTNEGSRKETGILADFIIRDEIVGSGAFATVKKAIERATGETFAVKIISKKKALTGAVEGVSRELKILQKLHHPGIVSLKAFYEDSESYYLVMEYVPGGDLMDFVASYGSVGEAAGCEIAKQILQAVGYVHSKGISHRDLKPDNILIAKDDPVTIKITDFGLAKGQDKANMMKTFCGTLAYLAPEVITGKYGAAQKKRYLGNGKTIDDSYSNKVDMWSIGCLLFVILTAHLPFSGSTQETLFKNIIAGNYHESLLKENGISLEGRDFLSRLLEIDVSLRLSTREALQHPWIQEISNEESQVSLSQSQSYQQRLSQKRSHFKVPQVPQASQQHHSHSQVYNHVQDDSLDVPPGTFLTLQLVKAPASHEFKEFIHIKQGKPTFCIGRYNNLDYTVLDDRISKLHAIITKKRHPIQTASIYESPAMGLEDIWLLDSSTNRCSRGNMKIKKGCKVKIFNGDEISFFKDKQKGEELTYKVIINDATGLFNNGEMDDSTEPIPMNERDLKMIEQKVNSCAISTSMGQSMITSPQKRSATAISEDMVVKRVKRADLFE